MSEDNQRTDVKIKLNKPKKGLSKDELEKLEKPELVEMIVSET